MSIYAVNGKEPIAAWIPSLDSVGNGTTTLTDLVGANNGTLTNMDAADWVLDDGKYSLDFKGGTDHVLIPYHSSLGFGSVEWAVSVWIKTSQTTPGIWLGKDVGGSRDFAFWGNMKKDTTSGAGYAAFFDFGGGSFDSNGAVITSGVWTHVLHTRRFYEATTYGETYVDGVLVQSSVIARTTHTLTNDFSIGGRLFSGFPSPLVMRLDDLRMFVGVSCNSADATYLAQSRGVVASVGKTRPRINGSLINSSLCRSSIT